MKLTRRLSKGRGRASTAESAGAGGKDIGKPPEGTRFHNELALTRRLLAAKARQRELSRASVLAAVTSGLVLAAMILCLAINVGDPPGGNADSPWEFDVAAFTAAAALLAALGSLAWPRQSLADAAGEEDSVKALPADTAPWRLVALAFVNDRENSPGAIVRFPHLRLGG
jgi:hypothetical protein